MIKHLVAIIWCLAFWGGFIQGKSVFPGEWNDKPIICANEQETFRAIKEKKDKRILHGFQKGLHHSV